MKTDGLLTKEQVFFISFMGVIGNIVYTHTWIDDATDRSAWVASLIGITAVLPFAAWMLYLGRQAAGGSILDIIESGMGKLASIAVCLCFFAVNDVLAAAQINMFTGMINTFFLMYTPRWVIISSLVIVSAMLAGSKITTLFRWIAVSALLGVFNYFATFVVIFPKTFRLEYVLPIFDTTVAGMLKAVLFIMGNASECLLLLAVIVGFMPSAKQYKSVALGILVGAVVFAFAIIIIIARMSPELAKKIAYGGVNAARLIQVGRYIQGLEVFILAAYQLIATAKVTMFIYCACAALKRIFNNKKPVLLLLVTSAMTLVPALFVGSYNEAYEIAVFAANYVTLPFSLLLILLAGIGVRMKKSRLESVKDPL